MEGPSLETFSVVSVSTSTLLQFGCCNPLDKRSQRGREGKGKHLNGSIASTLDKQRDGNHQGERGDAATARLKLKHLALNLDLGSSSTATSDADRSYQKRHHRGAKYCNTCGLQKPPSSQQTLSPTTHQGTQTGFFSTLMNLSFDSIIESTTATSHPVVDSSLTASTNGDSSLRHRKVHRDSLRKSRTLFRPEVLAVFPGIPRVCFNASEEDFQSLGSFDSSKSASVQRHQTVFEKSVSTFCFPDGPLEISCMDQCNQCISPLVVPLPDEEDDETAESRKPTSSETTYLTRLRDLSERQSSSATPKEFSLESGCSNGSEEFIFSLTAPPDQKETTPDNQYLFCCTLRATECICIPRLVLIWHMVNQRVRPCCLSMINLINGRMDTRIEADATPKSSRGPLPSSLSTASTRFSSTVSLGYPSSSNHSPQPEITTSLAVAEKEQGDDDGAGMEDTTSDKPLPSSENRSVTNQNGTNPIEFMTKRQALHEWTRNTTANQWIHWRVPLCLVAAVKNAESIPSLFKSLHGFIENRKSLRNRILERFISILVTKGVLDTHSNLRQLSVKTPSAAKLEETEEEKRECPTELRPCRRMLIKTVQSVLNEEEDSAVMSQTSFDSIQSVRMISLGEEEHLWARKPGDAELCWLPFDPLESNSDDPTVGLGEKSMGRNDVMVKGGIVSEMSVGGSVIETNGDGMMKRSPQGQGRIYLSVPFESSVGWLTPLLRREVAQLFQKNENADGGMEKDLSKDADDLDDEMAFVLTAPCAESTEGSSDLQYPLKPFAASVLVDLLSVEQFRILLAAVYLESQICVVSSSLGLRSAAIFALQYMISPFEWLHPALPICPTTMTAEDLFEAPVPFLLSSTSLPSSLDFNLLSPISSKHHPTSPQRTSSSGWFQRPPNFLKSFGLSRPQKYTELPGSELNLSPRGILASPRINPAPALSPPSSPFLTPRDQTRSTSNSRSFFWKRPRQPKPCNARLRDTLFVPQTSATHQHVQLLLLNPIHQDLSTGTFPPTIKVLPDTKLNSIIWDIDKSHLLVPEFLTSVSLPFSDHIDSFLKDSQPNRHKGRRATIDTPRPSPRGSDKTPDNDCNMTSGISFSSAIEALNSSADSPTPREPSVAISLPSDSLPHHRLFSSSPTCSEPIRALQKLCSSYAIQIRDLLQHFLLFMHHNTIDIPTVPLTPSSCSSTSHTLFSCNETQHQPLVDHSCAMQEADPIEGHEVSVSCDLSPSHIAELNCSDDRLQHSFTSFKSNSTAPPFLPSTIELQQHWAKFITEFLRLEQQSPLDSKVYNFLQRFISTQMCQRMLESIASSL